MINIKYIVSKKKHLGNRNISWFVIYENSIRPVLSIISFQIIIIVKQNAEEYSATKIIKSLH